MLKLVEIVSGVGTIMIKNVKVGTYYIDDESYSFVYKGIKFMKYHHKLSVARCMELLTIELKDIRSKIQNENTEEDNKDIKDNTNITDGYKFENGWVYRLSDNLRLGWYTIKRNPNGGMEYVCRHYIKSIGFESAELRCMTFKSYVDAFNALIKSVNKRLRK